MRKNEKTTITIFTIIILVTILGFFLLDIEKVSLNLWALGSLIISYIVVLLAILSMLINNDYGSLFYNAGMTISTITYELIVILTIIFLKEFSENPNWFILTQVIINSIFFIILLIFINISKNLNNMNERTNNNIEYSQNSNFKKFEDKDFNTPKRGGF